MSNVINKKLVHFDEKEDFIKRKDAGDILDTSIVFIKDANKIYTHGTEYQWVGWTELKHTNLDEYEFFLALDGTFSASDGEFYVKR